MLQQVPLCPLGTAWCSASWRCVATASSPSASASKLGEEQGLMQAAACPQRHSQGLGAEPWGTHPSWGVVQQGQAPSPSLSTAGTWWPETTPGKVQVWVGAWGRAGVLFPGERGDTEPHDPHQKGPAGSRGGGRGAVSSSLHPREGCKSSHSLTPPPPPQHPGWKVGSGVRRHPRGAGPPATGVSTPASPRGAGERAHGWGLGNRHPRGREGQSLQEAPTQQPPPKCEPRRSRSPGGAGAPHSPAPPPRSRLRLF